MKDFNSANDCLYPVEKTFIKYTFNYEKLLINILWGNVGNMEIFLYLYTYKIISG